MILSLPERLIASASTSDHQPMPMEATRNGSTAMAGADRFDRLLRDALVRGPVAAGNADAADAFAIGDDGTTAFHRGPPFRAGGERQPQRMNDIELLPLRAARGGRTLVRSRADGLDRGRMHRVKPPAF